MKKSAEVPAAFEHEPDSCPEQKGDPRRDEEMLDLVGLAN